VLHFTIHERTAPQRDSEDAELPWPASAAGQLRLQSGIPTTQFAFVCVCVSVIGVQNSIPFVAYRCTPVPSLHWFIRKLRKCTNIRACMGRYVSCVPSRLETEARRASTATTRTAAAMFRASDEAIACGRAQTSLFPGSRTAAGPPSSATAGSMRPLTSRGPDSRGSRMLQTWPEGVQHLRSPPPALRGVPLTRTFASIDLGERRRESCMSLPWSGSPSPKILKSIETESVSTIACQLQSGTEKMLLMHHSSTHPTAHTTTKDGR